MIADQGTAARSRTAGLLTMWIAADQAHRQKRE
jgi:hypothetical protein